METIMFLRRKRLNYACLIWSAFALPVLAQDVENSGSKANNTAATATDNATAASESTSAATDADPKPVVTDVIDPAFDKYVDLTLLAPAVEEADAGTLTDLALQAAFGESILERSHKAVTSKELALLALQVALDSNDDKSLDRLAKLAEKSGNDDLKAKISMQRKLGSASRSAPEVMVSLDRMSVDGLKNFKDYLTDIELAVRLGDRWKLDEIRNADLSALPEELQKRIADLIKAADEKLLEDGDALAKLVGVSRECKRHQPPTKPPGGYGPPTTPPGYGPPTTPPGYGPPTTPPGYTSPAVTTSNGNGIDPFQGLAALRGESRSGGYGTPTTPTTPGYGTPTTPTTPGYGSPTTPTTPGYGPPTTPTTPGYGPPTTPTTPGYGPPTTPTTPGYGPTTTPGYGPIAVKFERGPAYATGSFKGTFEQTGPGTWVEKNCQGVYQCQEVSRNGSDVTLRRREDKVDKRYKFNLYNTELVDYTAPNLSCKIEPLPLPGPNVPPTYGPQPGPNVPPTYGPQPGPNVPPTYGPQPGPNVPPTYGPQPGPQPQIVVPAILG